VARNVVEVVVVSVFSLVGFKAIRMCVGLNRRSLRRVVQ
jgi:hypothetical protein